MLIVDKVATLRFGRGVDLVGRIGVDEPTVLVQVNRPDVQRLMEVAQEMGEHKQSLFFVSDRKRPGRCRIF